MLKPSYYPNTLTILDNGRQEKSYMHIDDCINAMLHVYEHADTPMPRTTSAPVLPRQSTALQILVADEMGLNPDYEYTRGGCGWTGDVPKMRLSIEKLSALGWKPTVESERAIRRAIRGLLYEF